MRDIDTAEVDSLKVLDPNPPIREADIGHPGIVLGPPAAISVLLKGKRRLSGVDVERARLLHQYTPHGASEASRRYVIVPIDALGRHRRYCRIGPKPPAPTQAW